MKSMEKYENMTNPQLLVEIKNKNTMKKTFKFVADEDKLDRDIAYLWKLMEKNGYKKL